MRARETQFLRGVRTPGEAKFTMGFGTYLELLRPVAPANARVELNQRAGDQTGP